MATADYGTPTRPRHLCDPFDFNIVTKYASWYGDAYAHLGWQRDAFTHNSASLSRRRPREDHRRLDLSRSAPAGGGCAQSSAFVTDVAPMTAASDARPMLPTAHALKAEPLTLEQITAIRDDLLADAGAAPSPLPPSALPAPSAAAGCAPCCSPSSSDDIKSSMLIRTSPPRVPAARARASSRLPASGLLGLLLWLLQLDPRRGLLAHRAGLLPPSARP